MSQGAVLVLRASKLHCTCRVRPQNFSPRPSFCSLLHWASQISTDMQLTVDRELGARDFQLLDVLHSLLLYPDAKATPTGHDLGRPATYPGITSLDLEGYTCSSLIPDLVADAFPNLKSFTANWSPDPSQPLGPVLKRGLSCLQQVHVTLRYNAPDEDKPGVGQHIAQQLSHMPSMTFMDVTSHVFQAVTATALAKLKRLKLYAVGVPTAKDQAALNACSQLESLGIFHCAYGSVAGIWIQDLPQTAPSIQTLDITLPITNQHMPVLLALPHLTKLGVESLCDVSDDYSSDPCSWKRLTFTESCSNDITKLPLHALNSPVQCSHFRLILSDPAADLAAIRAAKPHLLRCGGITMKSGDLQIEISHNGGGDGGNSRTITKEQAAEVLAEWAPCLSVPTRIQFTSASKPLFEDALARLWPGAEVSVVPGWWLRQ